MNFLVILPQHNYLIDMKTFWTVIFISLGIISFGQEQFSKKDVKKFQKEMNEHYANPEKSPLIKEDLKDFKSLDFFKPNKKYFVKASFKRTPDEKPFEMPTSTDRKPLYVKYGEIHFIIDGKNLKLDVFQNVEMSRMPLYKNNLFLPFTDLTSGVTTYGGGRYLDLTIPETDVMYIDFNQAYNPYCAYNYKYSCPIPPPQNDLNVEINAGVKL